MWMWEVGRMSALTAYFNALLHGPPLTLRQSHLCLSYNPTLILLHNLFFCQLNKKLCWSAFEGIFIEVFLIKVFFLNNIFLGKSAI